MNYQNILLAVLSLGIMGALFGVLLAIASKAFAVKTDERIPLILECLPGANCGACGYAGCEAYAKSIIEDGCEVSKCSVGGDKTAKGIAEIMGLTVEDLKKLCATVRCCGTTEAAVKKYEYEGIADCDAAMRLAGGDKACEYSCMALGNCVKACRFDAVAIIDGVAVVDRNKCTACGLCVAACPKNLITLIPDTNRYYVGCSNKDKGGVTKALCSAGCIGCKICEKTCKYDAIHVTDNFSKINYEKCVSCGECAEKCPKKIIRCRFEA